MRFLIVLISLVPLLSGCAQFAARAIQRADYVDTAAWTYIMDVHNFRRHARSECFASLVRESAALEKDGREADIRALWWANYPGLVSFEALRAAQDDPTSFLSKPFGCGAPE